MSTAVEKKQIPCALPCDWYNLRTKELDAAKKALGEAHIIIAQLKDQLEQHNDLVRIVWEALPSVNDVSIRNRLEHQLIIIGDD